MKTEENDPVYPTDKWEWDHTSDIEIKKGTDPGLTKLEKATFMAMEGILSNISLLKLAEKLDDGYDHVGRMAIKAAKATIKKLNEEQE